MERIIIDRDDVNNPLHPTLFDQWCEQLGLDPETTDSIEITVAKAESL